MPTPIILSASEHQINGLLLLLKQFTRLFSQYHLIATEKTAARIREATGLAVESVTLGLPTNLKAACDNIASGNTRQGRCCSL